MQENFTLLWIGNRYQSPEIAHGLERAAYHLVAASDVPSAMETLRNQPVDLIVLENETSCVQGELTAVRLKSAAPRVPILLLCDPVQTGTPQAFFVNMILALRSGPEMLLRSIKSLLPNQSSRKTAS
jgi:response regulator RpfG family c-di-GMP phosphodiesterase